MIAPRLLPVRSTVFFFIETISPHHLFRIPLNVRMDYGYGRNYQVFCAPLRNECLGLEQRLHTNLYVILASQVLSDAGLLRSTRAVAFRVLLSGVFGAIIS